MYTIPYQNIEAIKAAAISLFGAMYLIVDICNQGKAYCCMVVSAVSVDGYSTGKTFGGKIIVTAGSDDK